MREDGILGHVRGDDRDAHGEKSEKREWGLCVAVRGERERERWRNCRDHELCLVSVGESRARRPPSAGPVSSIGPPVVNMVVKYCRLYSFIHCCYRRRESRLPPDRFSRCCASEWDSTI